MNIVLIEANANGYRSPIQMWPYDCVPEGYALIAEDVETGIYYEFSGFVNLTIEDGMVVGMTGNRAARQAWLDALPSPEQPEPTEQEDTAAMLVNYEYRLTLMELGITE